MSSRVVAAILGVAAADPAIYAKICGDGGGTFNPTSAFDGGTCGSVIPDGLLDKTVLSPADCDEALPDEAGLTVKDGMMMLQHNCCEGGTVPSSGLCGDHFPDGGVCASVGTFTPDKGTGYYTCNGDEDITDPNACQFGGKSGWDANEDEKCDTSRMELDSAQEAAACAQLGGTWQELQCYESAVYLRMVMKQLRYDPEWCDLCDGPDWCVDQTIPSVLEAYGSVCCSDGVSKATWCKKDPPAIAPGLCGGGGGAFNADLMVHGEKCGDVVAASGYQENTQLSESQCNAAVPDADGMAVKDVMAYAQYSCCEGGAVTRNGVCGDNFPDGGMCANFGMFMPGKGTGNHHCEGSEDSSDPTACAQAGGTWKELMCFESAMAVSSMMKERRFDPDWCDLCDGPDWCPDADIKGMFEMATACCRDGKSKVDWCEERVGNGQCVKIPGRTYRKFDSMGKRPKDC